MSELSTLARPYAEAVFRIAESESDLAGWSARLATLAAIAADPQAAALIADPSVASARVSALIVVANVEAAFCRETSITQTLPWRPSEGPHRSISSEICHVVQCVDWQMELMLN